MQDDSIIGRQSTKSWYLKGTRYSETDYRKEIIKNYQKDDFILNFN